MRISHESTVKKWGQSTGYSYARTMMLRSLDRLGYEVKFEDPDADVQIWFEQPENWEWSGKSYKVGYFPWESTGLKPGALDGMNSTDELWTPSPLLAEWFRDAGCKRPIYVYEHGVDKIWTPVDRKIDDKIRFLHLGAEAARKGGWDVLSLFRKAFHNRNDVELTLKMDNQGWTNIERVGKTTIINRVMGIDELVELFHSHHVYVYPSSGEGFGLTPLQAMATGMPTITVPAWAPYERFLDPRLNLRSSLKPSPWPEIHPGKVLRPNFDDIIDKMRWVADNYEEAHKFALDQTPRIQVEYDWDTLTKDVFEGLEKRI